MSERAEQQSTTSLPWWGRVCRAGWKVVRFFWAIFILTLVPPKAVDVLFSDKPLRSLPNLWPILEAIVHYPVWTLLTFLGLLLLTGLFWFGSRERATTTQGTLSWLLEASAQKTERAEVKPAQVPSDTVFLVNLPLTDPNEFFGRMLERTKLLSRTRKGACTSIVGPRRIGKTWLISYLRLVASTQLGMNFHIGYLDATMPSCTSVPGFTTEVLKVLGFPFFSTLTNPSLTTLEGFVKDMVARNQAPILCIDEFEGFASHQQDFDFNFFTGLRAITQVGLGLVVVSKNPLIDIVSENTKTSPFFNVFLQLKLEPFGVEDAEKFAQVKSAQAGFTDQERAYLLKYGQKGEQQWPPLRLQLVGDMLLEDKNLAAREGSSIYDPDTPDYWLDFRALLEDTYQGMVKQ